MEDLNSNFRRIILHPLFNSTLEELSKKKIKIPEHKTFPEFDFSLQTYPPNGKLVTSIGEIKSIGLDPKKGESLVNEEIILGYDESIANYDGLEGASYLMSHSLVIYTKDDYVPLVLLSFYFYTRAKKIVVENSNIKYSEDPNIDSKNDYVKDRATFLLNNSIPKSILLIDGPLIGGQISYHTTQLNNQLLEKDIIPIFFVKNSRSNMVTDNSSTLKENFNSDMHWAYKTLGAGQRTNFFKYVDAYNEDFGKIFCYLKAFDVSPQRIEFHVKTLEKYGKDKMAEIMNLIYYLNLVQGNKKDPQIRIISIAELFAKEMLKIKKIEDIMDELNITPSINQSRWWD